jgi:membrane associated rhomboid family serine protease
MLVIPYSTALKLSKPPVVTYVITIICVIIFLLQLSSDITESLMYYPESWNPIKMVTQSLAHGSWSHLIGNMIFYLAFAPALEIILGNKIRYIWIMLFISFVVGVCFSFAVLTGAMKSLPSLGFSGVVMGMIGLSAYLMPRARIRVFCWYVIAWKTVYVRSWILAAGFIGLDAWTMLTVEDYGYINVVAHVAGGFAGYLYGFFWLKERKEEVQDELDHEVKAMRISQQHGKTRAEAFRYNKVMDENLSQKKETQDHDKFMGKVYQQVKTDRDNEAVLLLMTRYGLDTSMYELEMLFNRVEEWGPSRTLLCVGRLIIQILDQEHRHGKAIVFIEKCQKASPQFVLPDISRVLFYAEMAVDAGKTEVVKNLLKNSPKRYGSLLNTDQCNHLLQKVI